MKKSLIGRTLLALVATAGLAACGVAPAEELAASDVGASSAALNGYYCKYKHKDRGGAVDFSNHHGHQIACDPHSSDWYETCRDHQGSTEELGCFSHGSGSGHSGNAYCQYKHKDRHNQVDSFDYFGMKRSCTPGHRDSWYETCRDHNGNTEELGCVSDSVSHTGRCKYKHKNHHGKVDYRDHHGNSKSCSSSDRSVWYEECRDYENDTEELGCEF
jgi:hypothetical protein